VRHAGLTSRAWLGVALTVFAVVWLATLAGRSLISADEGRYATLSLGMLQSGDWITPRLNGLLYFEKPPLQYWGGALSLWLFGINEFAARLWAGLAGLATVFLVGHTAARLWGPRAGLHALLICGATTWIAVNSHFLSLDAGLTATLTLVLCSVLIAECSTATPPQRRRWMLAAWVGMGLAVLSKGLVGVLIPGAVLTLHSLWRLDVSVWRRLRWWPGLALLLVITVPWFALVSARNPDFAWFFFVHEHFQRYLTTVHDRQGAWWYFVPYLLLGFVPWTSALPWLLRPRRADVAAGLLLVWVVFIFLFFSDSDSKLPSYILPVFPALALLLAREIDRTSVRALRLHLLAPALLWIAALPVLTQTDRFVANGTPRPAVEALARGVSIGAVLALAGLALAWQLLGRQRRTMALAAVAMTHLGATLVVLQSHDTYGQLKSGDAIARALAPRIDAATPVYSVRSYEQTLPFYLRRSIILVDYRDEFAFGEQHEPDRWIPTLDAFIARWQREPRAAAYMTQPTFDELRRRGVPMQVVYQDPRRLVVVKP
jgi:4-amino-4-deoxy-L-arabinose transferase-like glycosyltransferase